MIDFHTHILPQIDDGSKSVEETFKLLKEAENAGFKKIISTSHYIENYYEVDAIERKAWVDALNQKTDLKLYLGNEIYITNNIVELLRQNKVTTINGTKYLLFELPLNINEQPLNLNDFIYTVLNNKMIPILAHPERYLFAQKNPDLIYDLIQKGVLMQCNYGSIIGLYGKRAQIIVKQFYKNNLYK